MNIVTNPFVWLCRFRHRCGYGVHSPFAFRFITDVIYERQPYYAYATLRTLLPPTWRLRRRRGLELLFRLANYQQPKRMAVFGQNELAVAYLHGGCRKALILQNLKSLTSGSSAERIDLCFLSSPNNEAVDLMASGGMLVVDNLQSCRTWFKALPATLFFDLHDIGIALFNIPYHKQYYIVNF